MKYIIKLFLLLILFSTELQAQMGQLKTPACTNSYKQLQKYLDKLEAKKKENDMASYSYQTYLKTASKYLKAIRIKCPKENLSKEVKQLDNYKLMAENANKIQAIDEPIASNNANAEDDDRAYFERYYRLLSKVYSNTPNGADGTDLGKHSEKTITILEEFGDFSLKTYNKKVESVSNSDAFKQSEYYIKRSKAILDDYDNFISKSRNTYNNYLSDLNAFGVKGDPINELKELNEAKAFCEILLKISSNNAIANQWKKEIESKILQTSGKLSFKSEMHKKYLGRMVFSKVPLVIGQEKESDIASTFKSGDYIYATVYLGTNARALTDSYALNNCEVKVNNYLVAPGDETGVWFTTKMQDSKVIQFAILPSDEWLNKYGEPYKKHNVKTHYNISQIIKEQNTNQIKVELELMFNGSGSRIKGSFVIN